MLGSKFFKKQHRKLKELYRKVSHQHFGEYVSRRVRVENAKQTDFNRESF